MVRVARAPGPHRTDRPRHAKKQCHSWSEEVSRRDERGETQDAHSIVRVLSALGCGRMVCHESRLGMCFEPHSWRGRGAGAGAPHRPQSEIRPGALGILRVPGLPPQTSRVTRANTVRWLPPQTSPACRPRNAPAPPPPSAHSAHRPPLSPPTPRPSSHCTVACRTTPRSPASGAKSGSPTSPSAPRASSSRPTGWRSPPARSTS
eukprot:scaffold8081_cov65-Phaeocystis_antarctica.AAC.9